MSPRPYPLLILITAPHFCAGFEHDGRHVTNAAPILRYMIGKHVNWCLHYAKKKGWVTTILPLEDHKPNII